MAVLDDESVFGPKPKPRLAHEIGQKHRRFVGARARGAYRPLAFGDRATREGDRGASSDPCGGRLYLQGLIGSSAFEATNSRLLANALSRARLLANALSRA